LGFRIKKTENALTINTHFPIADDQTRLLSDSQTSYLASNVKAAADPQ
jgi:hypothetical protein